MEWAAEINLRAQRRAGEMLRDMDIKAGRPEKINGTNEVPIEIPKTLTEQGITKNQSSAWQSIAKITTHLAND